MTMLTWSRHDHMADTETAFDTHDGGVYDDGTHVCPGDCRFRGTEQEWLAHLADALADALTTTTLELPEVNT